MLVSATEALPPASLRRAVGQRLAHVTSEDLEIAIAQLAKFDASASDEAIEGQDI